MLLGSNKDGGHGTNACLTLSLTAGKTYYILLQGNSATTTGTTTFEVNRGLPLSGSEKPNNCGTYNSVDWLTHSNCYTFALYIFENPITGSSFEGIGVKPGEIAGSPISDADLANAETAKAAIVAAVKRDCVAWGGSGSDFYEVSENTMVPSGYFKVALVLNPGHDFHWFRQVSDMEGAWCHKLSANRATKLDDNGDTIFCPSDAVINGYTDFLGYFAVKVPPQP